MDIHSNKCGSAKAKKKFSFRSLGITSYHAAPAVLMAVAGLALATIISDVPPAYNQAFASNEVVIVEDEKVNTQVSAVTNTLADRIPTQDVLDLKVEDVHSNLLASSIANLKSDVEEEETDFSVFTSAVSEAEAANKLWEIQLAERERELWEARGESVYSSNRNLYLDTYRYGQGNYDIPATGAYTSCVKGEMISQMVPPSTLTFDENGVPETYLYKIEGKSTAYCSGTATSTGSRVRPGVVAVDPREIPYGTEMWIVSSDGKYVYGFARAEDTGGFIYWPRGATVDLFMNSYSDCRTWGWRDVTIYVLPTSYK